MVADFLCLSAAALLASVTAYIVLPLSCVSHGVAILRENFDLRMLITMAHIRTIGFSNNKIMIVVVVVVVLIVVVVVVVVVVMVIVIIIIIITLPLFLPDY